MSKDGIRQIKSTLTNQIFQQEMLHLYEQKSKSRDELVQETRQSMLYLAKSMQEMTCDHPEAENLIWELSRQLPDQRQEVLRLSAEVCEETGGRDRGSNGAAAHGQ